MGLLMLVEYGVGRRDPAVLAVFLGGRAHMKYAVPCPCYGYPNLPALPNFNEAPEPSSPQSRPAGYIPGLYTAASHRFGSEAASHG